MLNISASVAVAIKYFINGKHVHNARSTIKNQNIGFALLGISKNRTLKSTKNKKNLPQASFIHS